MKVEILKYITIFVKKKQKLPLHEIDRKVRALFGKHVSDRKKTKRGYVYRTQDMNDHVGVLNIINNEKRVKILNYDFSSCWVVKGRNWVNDLTLICHVKTSTIEFNSCKAVCYVQKEHEESWELRKLAMPEIAYYDVAMPRIAIKLPYMYHHNRDLIPEQDGVLYPRAWYVNSPGIIRKITGNYNDKLFIVCYLIK